MRGEADAARRCGCATTMTGCTRASPADEIARAMFDAVEQARCEALGARRMAGVARQSRRPDRARCAPIR